MNPKLFIISALLLVPGCRHSDPDPIAALSLKLIDAEAKLDAANAKLDTLLARKPLLPIFPIGAEAAPDVNSAISHSLKAAAALVGNTRVIEFFKERAGDIVEKRAMLPPITKQALKARVQEDFADDIRRLLN